jgi:choline dehydrogenase-like flavoprotein
MYVPPKQFFDAPEWAGITDWADELAPYYDQATRMLGAVRYPYMPTDVDRAIHEVAVSIGRGETHNKAPVGVYFGTPGVEAEDPYFGGVGPRRTGCISCGICNNGCGHNAKNKVTTNYLYLAEKLGAEVCFTCSTRGGCRRCRANSGNVRERTPNNFSTSSGATVSGSATRRGSTSCPARSRSRRAYGRMR